MTRRALPQLIDQIYEAALRPDLWPEVLSSAASVMNAATASLLLHDRATNSFRHIALHPSYPLEASHAYASHYASIDPMRNKASRLPARTIYTMNGLFSARDLSTFEVYSDFYLKWGWGRLLTAFTDRGAAEQTAFAFHRPAKRPAFSSDERKIAAELMPHIFRSVEIVRKFDEVAESERLSAEAFAVMDSAAILVNDRGRVILANAAAERIFTAGTSLRVENRMLTAVSPSERCKLERCIREASADTPSAGECTIRRPGDAPLRLILSPVRTEGERGVLIIANSFRDDVTEAVSRLQSAHGLTIAEARVGVALCHGLGLAVIASVYGISIHTVRSHVKNIAFKLGVSSQTQIVAELLRGPGFVVMKN